MYSYDFWNAWKQMNKEMVKLKAENQALKEKLASLQPIQIEKIEYKINELVVETLSGTLNIGLSAHTDEQGLQQVIDKIKMKEDPRQEVDPPSSKKQG